MNTIEKTAIGHAKRYIADGEVIGITINPDGSLDSDAICFLKGVTFADLHKAGNERPERGKK